MVRRVHHINFLVHDLDAAVPVYERLLDTPVACLEDLPDRGARTARFHVGETWIVLVEPTREDSVPAHHLRERGEGFFLVSLEVDSLADSAARLGDLLAGPARDGLADWRVMDLEPEHVFGARLQLVEPGAGKGGTRG